jgi:hypothetical protein
MPAAQRSNDIAMVVNPPIHQNSKRVVASHWCNGLHPCTMACLPGLFPTMHEYYMPQAAAVFSAFVSFLLAAGLLPWRNLLLQLGGCRWLMRVLVKLKDTWAYMSAKLPRYIAVT